MRRARRRCASRGCADHGAWATRGSSRSDPRRRAPGQSDPGLSEATAARLPSRIGSRLRCRLEPRCSGNAICRDTESADCVFYRLRHRAACPPMSTTPLDALAHEVIRNGGVQLGTGSQQHRMAAMRRQRTRNQRVSEHGSPLAMIAVLASRSSARCRRTGEVQAHRATLRLLFLPTTDAVRAPLLPPRPGNPAHTQGQSVDQVRCVVTARCAPMRCDGVDFADSGPATSASANTDDRSWRRSAAD